MKKLFDRNTQVQIINYSLTGDRIRTSLTKKMKNYSSMSDKELYALAKRFGEEALAARRKFAGLLPEVARRRLYEKKGYSCLYEFAAKLAGMSREQVDTIIRLERKFEDKPALHAKN